MIFRLDPPLFLETPKGKATAHFLIDYGYEHHLVWVCCIDESHECWSFENPQVKFQPNETARYART